ncbi:hypothetical protein BO71DRAFT_6452 [Aspergillus ellipticus CBS 707.79]|uniref:Uncharacterized protein n=1 Tax=Aspergillus ellipticus CBS 707.79 TaxID=1448320 RepID=A0A319D7F1_9EURO|nr:hypothetical protein BO71DRAFT_6452 [Aspergillus ellipticus CBS 707.79]
MRCQMGWRRTKGLAFLACCIEGSGEVFGAETGTRLETMASSSLSLPTLLTVLSLSQYSVYQVGTPWPYSSEAIS